MEALRVHSVSIHELHEPIQPSRGSVGPWEIEMGSPSFSLVTERYDSILHGAIGKLVTTPFRQASYALSHLPFGGCAGDVPDRICGGGKQATQCCGGPISSREIGMQEAFDHEHGGKKRAPGGVGGLPAIGVDGVRFVGGKEPLGVFCEDARAVLQGLGTHRVDRFDAYETPVGTGGGDRPYHALDRHVIVVGHTMPGQF